VVLPKTKEELDKMIADGVKKSIEDLVKAGEKRSLAPGAGSTPGGESPSVLDIVSKAHREFGWEGVEGLAEELLQKSIAKPGEKP
jgi:hypothetical protein